MQSLVSRHHINFCNAASERRGFAMTICGASEMQLKSNGISLKIELAACRDTWENLISALMDISLSEKLGEKNNVLGIETWKERSLCHLDSEMNPGKKVFFKATEYYGYSYTFFFFLAKY